MARKTSDTITLDPADTSPAAQSPKEHPAVVDAAADVTAAAYTLQAARSALLAAESRGKRPEIAAAKQAVRDAEQGHAAAMTRLLSATEIAQREWLAATRDEHRKLFDEIHDQLTALQAALVAEWTFRENARKQGVDARILPRPNSKVIPGVLQQLAHTDLAAIKRSFDRAFR
jgi:hypothetical protein